MKRRTLIVAAPAFALMGCQELTKVGQVVEKLPQYAEDLKDLTGSLKKIAGSVDTVVGLPATVKTTVKGWVDQAVSLGDKAIAAVGTSGAITAVADFAKAFQQIATGTNDGNSAMGTFASVVKAGISLMPTILALAGIALGPTDVRPMPMPPEVARATLKSIAARG